MKEECKSVRAMLSPYLDHEVSPDEKDDLTRHLRRCSGCRRELQRLDSILRSVRKLPRVQAPAGLADEVLRRLATGPKAEGRSPDVIRIWPRMMAAAASFLLISATTLLLINAPPRQLSSQIPDHPAFLSDALHEEKIDARKIVSRSAPAPRTSDAPALESEELTGIPAETARAFRDPGTARPVGKDLHLKEPLGARNLSLLFDILRSTGVQHLTMNVETGGVPEDFGFHFYLEADRLDDFHASLGRAFTLEAVHTVTAGEEMADPQIQREVSGFPGWEGEAHEVLETEKREPSSTISITVRFTGDAE